MKKVLVTGGSGLLGRYLALTQPIDYDGMYAGFHSQECNMQIDVTDKSSLYRLFSDYKPDVLIHTAALANVDFCEQVPSVADSVNVGGTANIVDILNELHYKTKVVYISTNTIYDGTNPPYNEQSPTNPLNKYGYSKWTAERYVQRNCKDWIVIRPVLMYGFPYLTARDTWLTKLINLFENGGEISLVTDVMWQPTSARFVANVIWTVLNQSNESFNVSQGETMSLYDFGIMIQNRFAPNKDVIKPISVKKLQHPAKRPYDTSFDISKVKQFIDVPTVTEELNNYYDELQLLWKNTKPRIY